MICQLSRLSLRTALHGHPGEKKILTYADHCAIPKASDQENRERPGQAGLFRGGGLRLARLLSVDGHPAL